MALGPMKAMLIGSARCGEASRTPRFESSTVGNGLCAWVCAAATNIVAATVRQATAHWCRVRFRMSYTSKIDGRSRDLASSRGLWLLGTYEAAPRSGFPARSRVAPA